MKIETINTDRTRLEVMTKKYEEDIFKLLRDEQIVENLNLKLHTSINDTRQLMNDYFKGMKENKKYPYVIIDKEKNCFIGVFLLKIDLYQKESYEFTIFLAKEFWGKGIYNEVLQSILKLVFKKIKTKNFRGYVKENNIASMRVLEKNRFYLEKKFKVDHIDRMIYSYLMTDEMYQKEFE